MTTKVKYRGIMVNLLALHLMCHCLEAGICNKEGKPFTRIVVAPDAPATVKLAAGELQKYLKEVCRADLPVADKIPNSGLPIFVGQSDELAKFNLSARGLKPDEFRIVGNGRMLAIFGNDYQGPPIGGLRKSMSWFWNPQLELGTFGSAGTLFGVYNFLEKFCGIRWYMPGPAGTVIPEKKRLAVPDIDYAKHPAFPYRSAYLCELTNNPEAVLWYRRLGFGGAFNIEINHSFSLFAKYIETNSDYFALVDGQRDFGNKCATQGGGPQLCLTNPKVVDQWVNDICEYFSKHPKEICYPVVPGDGLKRVCECPSCRREVQENVPEAKMYSNHIWGFVNRVAEKTALKYPDKYIGCLAYERFSAPPDFKMHPNVVVMFCKTRGSFVNPAYKKTIRENIDAWQKKVSTPLYFWEYYLWHWLPWQNLPVIYPHIIKEDIGYLKSINAGGEKIEAEEHPAFGNKEIYHPGMQHLNLYVTGKLQWEPDLDIDELLEEYFRLFYGPAQKEMREFWLYAEKIYADAGTGEVLPERVFTADVLDKLSFLLNAAISRTKPDSVYLRRLEIIQKEFTSGKNRLIAATMSQKPAELVLTGPAKIQNGKISYSKPVKFRDNLDNSSFPPEMDTDMSLARDKTNLYLNFVCFEEDIKNLKTKCQNRDDGDIWRDDCIEIFICPDPGNLSLCYQVIVTAAGTVWDGKYSKPDNIGSPDSKWQAGVKVKNRIYPDRWTIEVEIPLKDIELDGNHLSGKSIVANFYRNLQDRDGTKYASWSPTGNIAHLEPSRFGSIIFK